MTTFQGTNSHHHAHPSHETSTPHSRTSTILFEVPHRRAFLCTLQNMPQPCDYSEKTLASYYHWCSRFWEHYHDKGTFPTRSIQDFAALQELCEDYLWGLKQTKLSQSSIAQAQAAMSFLQRCCFPKNKRPQNHLGRPTPSSPRTRALSQEELQKIFRKMDENTRLAALLMYSCGLRLFEALRLRIRDLDLTQMTILVRDSRGKPSRVIKIARDAYDPLMQHLRHAKWRYQEEARLGLASVRLPARLRRTPGQEAVSWNWRYLFMSLRSPLFCGSTTSHQDHMHESTVQKSIQKAAQILEIQDPVSCSNLRASFVEHLLDAGYPPSKVRLLCVTQELSWDFDTHWHIPGELAHIPSPLDLWKTPYRPEQ
ncbi:MAG: tyrosine-type recombinase/integrase [Myxococcales bacterium]|nr:tyrosine-type recombinase/integrase [Myxococcales bacterium]